MADEPWNGKHKIEVETMEDEKTKDKKKVQNYLFVVFIALIAIGVTILVVTSDKEMTNNRACCEKICGQLNQKCRGWVQDTLQCSYNYERFGYPWITEVFTFMINESSKTAICSVNGTLPQVLPQIPINTTA